MIANLWRKLARKGAGGAGRKGGEGVIKGVIKGEGVISGGWAEEKRNKGQLRKQLRNKNEFRRLTTHLLIQPINYRVNGQTPPRPFL